MANQNIGSRERDRILKQLQLNNYTDKITLLAYCLMPNHFHLFVKQTNKNAIHKFMQSLTARYSMYFNRKYKRIGPLFQSVYKAVLVDNETQFIYLSKYIHQQSLNLQGLNLQGDTLGSLKFKQPSSYYNYLGQRKTKWVDTQEVLSYFSKTNSNNSYKSFIEEKEDFGVIQNILLD